MVYTLYYSLRCKYCSDFCSMLTAYPELAKQFTFVDAAKVPSRGMSVPMIIVNNQPLVGRDAFVWLQSMIADMSGPQCYDLSDCGGMTYSEIDGPAQGTTSRSSNYCDLRDVGATTMSVAAASPRAQVMDARVARLIQAREAQLPGPIRRI